VETGEGAVDGGSDFTTVVILHITLHTGLQVAHLHHYGGTVGLSFLGIPDRDVTAAVTGLTGMLYVLELTALAYTHIDETEVVIVLYADGLIALFGRHDLIGETTGTTTGGVPLTFALTLGVDLSEAGVYLSWKDMLSAEVLLKGLDGLTSERP
jgi:hypothetical protein